MASKNQITLAQVLELVPGTEADPTWVDDFEAIVTVGDTRATNSGKQMWNCVLSDPHSPNVKLNHVFWDNPTRYDGALCLFSGSMRMEEYNGKPQLKLGKKTLIAVKAAGTDSVRPSKQAPQSSPPPASHNAGNGPQWRPDGQTIGMSIKEACEFARAGGKGFDKAFIYETASALLRLSQKLAMGQLVPLAGQPAPSPQPAPPPPQPAPPHQRPRPGPEGSAFQYGQSGGHAAPGDIDESDVPFSPITI